MLHSVLLLLQLIVIAVDGSHFLGGTITWSPLNQTSDASSVLVSIKQTYSWTWIFGACTNSDIANSKPIPFTTNFNGISNKLNCISNCSNANGYIAPPILPYCTDASSVQGSSVGQRSDIVRLNQGSDFKVAFADNAWRPLTTATAAAWSISARINLIIRPDNRLYNNAPVSNMMSPINIPSLLRQAIHVPVGDADGDTIRCRWSNGFNECGNVCPPTSLPNNTILYPNCTILITGTKAGDWFAVALTIEDFIDSTSTTPLSAVPVQFLVRITARSICGTAPSIIGLPKEGSCTPVKIGQTFLSRLIAINSCGPNVTISDVATLSFSGMIQSNVTRANSTFYYKTLQWTPNFSHLGYEVMCAIAMDSEFSQSVQYCFKFYVSTNDLCACPGEICPTTTTTTEISTGTPILTTTSSSTTPLIITRTITTRTSLATTTAAATSDFITSTFTPTEFYLSSTTSSVKTQTATEMHTTISTSIVPICGFLCNSIQVKISFGLMFWCSTFLTIHFL